MYETVIRIALTEDQLVAAKFIVATWEDRGTAPQLIEYDGVLELELTGGKSAVSRALEAAQAATSHGGGLAASARDLAVHFERFLRE